MSPANGTEFSGGETVRFVFTVTTWDGGVWPTATIPASTSGGASGPATLTKVGTTFEGDFVLANTTGLQRVTAGWTAANATIEVRARTCSASCEPWEGCVADSDGGSCADLGLTLDWVEPDAGQQFGPRDYASVPLRLTASRADGGPFTADIPYSLDGVPSGLLSRTGAFWTGSVDAGPTSGGRTLTAGWSGGPEVSRSFEVVTSPPTVTLVAPPLIPPRAPHEMDDDMTPRWKKTEVAVFRVESNRFLEVSSLVFSSQSVVPLPSTSCGPCGDVACLCYGVELAREPLLGGVGTVSVSLTGAEDVLGNVLTGVASRSFPVTRLKWKRELAMASLNPLPISLTSGGVAVAGARTGALGSQLSRVTPDGGISSIWSSVTELITAGPIVGEQADIFVATETATLAQLVRNPGPSQVVRCPSTIATGRYDGDLALQSPGSSEVVYAVRSDGVLAPGTSTCAVSIIGDGTSGPLAGRPSLAIQSSDVFVAGAGSAPVWKFLATAANPSPRGWVSTSMFPSNLFLVGAGISGGGGGGPATGGVFAVVNPAGSLDGGTAATATPSTTPGGAAVVGGQVSSLRYVYYGDNSGFVRRVSLIGTSNISLSGAISSAQVAGVRFSDRAPLLGEGDKVYVIGSDGILRVLRSDTLAEEWNWPGLFPSTAAISQLNADIDRSVPSPCASGQPGILYAAATVGGVTTLRALLVDSQGVDKNAPWPRHQHNPANTANPATSLLDWTCP